MRGSYQARPNEPYLVTQEAACDRMLIAPLAATPTTPAPTTYQSGQHQLLFKNPGCCRKSRNGQCGLSKQTENTQKAEGLAWRVSVCSGYGRDLPRSRRPDKPTGSHWTISGTTDLALLLGQTLCEGVCVWGRIWLPFNGPLLFRHPPLLLVRTFTSFVVVPASPGNDVHSHPQTDSSSAHPLAESNHGQHHI